MGEEGPPRQEHVGNLSPGSTWPSSVDHGGFPRVYILLTALLPCSPSSLMYFFTVCEAKPRSFMVCISRGLRITSVMWSTLWGLRQPLC